MKVILTHFLRSLVESYKVAGKRWNGDIIGKKNQLKIKSNTCSIKLFQRKGAVN